jgi:hypothetical protein
MIGAVPINHIRTQSRNRTFPSCTLDQEDGIAGLEVSDDGLSPSRDAPDVASPAREANAKEFAQRFVVIEVSLDALQVNVLIDGLREILCGAPETDVVKEHLHRSYLYPNAQARRTVWHLQTPAPRRPWRASPGDDLGITYVTTCTFCRKSLWEFQPIRVVSSAGEVETPFWGN